MGDCAKFGVGIECWGFTTYNYSGGIVGVRVLRDTTVTLYNRSLLKGSFAVIIGGQLL